MKYSTKIKLLGQTRCKKCGGRIFLDADTYGWYAQCFICGNLRNLVPESAHQIQKVRV
jgi:hypothetical protein